MDAFREAHSRMACLCSIKKVMVVSHPQLAAIKSAHVRFVAMSKETCLMVVMEPIP